MGARKTAKELHTILSNALRLTPQYQEFKHVVSNRIYVVQGVVLDEATLKPLVIYRPLECRDISWARTQEDFLNKFT